MSNRGTADLCLPFPSKAVLQWRCESCTCLFCCRRRLSCPVGQPVKWLQTGTTALSACTPACRVYKRQFCQKKTKNYKAQTAVWGEGSNMRPEHLYFRCTFTLFLLIILNYDCRDIFAGTPQPISARKNKNPGKPRLIKHWHDNFYYIALAVTTSQPH